MRMEQPNTAAIRAARAAGIAYRLHAYPPETPDSLTAAALIGVEPARILKTLVAELDRARLVVAVLPVTARLEHAALAAALSAERAKLAPAEVAERVTGYKLRSISPLGLLRPLPVVLDERICEHATVFVSIGLPGFELELTPSALALVTAAVIVRIAGG